MLLPFDKNYYKRNIHHNLFEVIHHKLTFRRSTQEKEDKPRLLIMIEMVTYVPSKYHTTLSLDKIAFMRKNAFVLA